MSDIYATLSFFTLCKGCIYAAPTKPSHPHRFKDFFQQPLGVIFVENRGRVCKDA